MEKQVFLPRAENDFILTALCGKTEAVFLLVLLTAMVLIGAVWKKRR